MTERWPPARSGTTSPRRRRSPACGPPPGGLAWGAAVACAVGLGLAELARSDLPRLEVARAAQRAEREVVGTPVGIMDQAASLLARAGHAPLLDCRSCAAELRRSPGAAPGEGASASLRADAGTAVRQGLVTRLETAR